MANRAYLYPHPSPALEPFSWALPARYYDSRHTIPIGWFFFFRGPNVTMVDVQDWQEVKFAAPKAEAVDLFRSRRPLLDRYLADQPLRDAAATLLDNLTRWPGDHLLMDPGEVLDDDDLRHKTQFQSTCEALDSAEPERIDRALSAYCARLSDNPDTRLCQVLGYTYRWE